MSGRDGIIRSLATIAPKSWHQPKLHLSKVLDCLDTNEVSGPIYQHNARYQDGPSWMTLLYRRALPRRQRVNQAGRILEKTFLQFHLWHLPPCRHGVGRCTLSSPTSYSIFRWACWNIVMPSAYACVYWTLSIENVNGAWEFTSAQWILSRNPVAHSHPYEKCFAGSYLSRKQAERARPVTEQFACTSSWSKAP